MPGVELGRTGAIRTDERMETNLRGVYAAGDCAEVQHLVTGRPTYIPLGTTANKAGRVAGRQRRRGPRALRRHRRHVDRRHLRDGLRDHRASPREQARAEGFSPVSARIEANARPRYFGGGKTIVELIADRATRRLVGGSVIGEDEASGRINVIAAALQARMKVEDFESLDLAYSPPFATVWDPLLIAAQQLIKEL